VTSETKPKLDPNITYIPLVQQALEALQSLNPVERAILGLRFGLEDGEERDLDAVARHYGVSAEIIHSVEIDALRKLRHHDCFHKQCKKRKLRPLHEGPRVHLSIVE
jgi:DNA-directed RNA polymerase sigma subunit (sigma70/sigma32)